MNKYEEAYIELVDYVAGLKESQTKHNLKEALLVIKELVREKK